MNAAAREVRDGLCGICPAGCWVRATLHDGRLIEVAPLPDHPLGTSCAIGRHSPDIVHDPKRLRTPLRRVGPKGTHDFRPISWDEAMGEIALRLQAIKAEHGPEATAIYTGRGSFDMAMCDLFQPAGVAVSSASSVLFPFGSPNTLGVGALCYVSFAMIAPHVTMGELHSTMDVDLDQAELIVVWGANPATDSPPYLHEKILAARRRGARVIVIDPRRNGTARAAAAQWVPIRPGTDGALALGLIQVIIAEELYQEQFVERWTLGFPELAGYVQHFRPEVVEGITGVPAATVVDLARAIARARGACPVMYTGLEYSDSGVQAIRAVFTLWALAGQLDVPGGLNFRMKEGQFPQNRRHLQPNPNVGRALGRDRFPVYSSYRGESHAICLPPAVLDGDPYRIRALLVLGASLITSWPDPDLWSRTLNALDFLVCIDRYLTADAAFADIVLPATTLYEITSFMRYGPIFKIRERLVEPQGEARNDFLILAELAQRLGYGHLYPQTEEAILERALEGTGFTVEEVRAAGGSVSLPAPMMEYHKWEKGRLRPDGQPGFDTPSGRFEIASSILAEHGYDALPVYTEPAEGPQAAPELARRYPLVFNSGARTQWDFRSQHHGVPRLAARNPEPRVHLNTCDAQARGIADGKRVWVETPRGRLQYLAQVDDDIVPGAVEAAMGGGGPLGAERWRATNVNRLTDLSRFDPISGFPVYKTLLCEVVRAEGSTDAGGGGTAFAPPPDAEREAVARPAAAPLRNVYLDCNATTPPAPAVCDALDQAQRATWANPSSIHAAGGLARGAVEDARRRVAHLLNTTARRVLFTSGGSEADNLAILGIVEASGVRPAHVVTTAIEHPAVLRTCRALEACGHAVSYLPVDGAGRVDPGALAAALRPNTVLVSVMLANNETGVIQPIAELAAIARARGVPFHTDAVQAFGRIPVDVAALGVDLLSVSAHKLYGPKGIGALFVRKGIVLEPRLYGGGQEGGLRAGTENVPGIIGFGRACDLAEIAFGDGTPGRIAALRDRLEAGVLRLVPGARRNGDAAPRLPNTSNLSLRGIRGESLVLELDRHGIRCSSGSACRAGHPDPSHALLAMGLTVEEAHCAVRFSLGRDTTAADIDYVLMVLDRTLRDTFQAVRFVGCR
ncbi:aminotransferase class V-fold PLP-dependent enzyme [uncultured Thiodictyon sp.]|uniref:aminotransferase class V-fold PLP-dependent enzyme n=1 Tax=uncultured Thiodictyon sp. TaxID=1846217 RepID=UPI0025FBAEDD|nr:aminotransferase class V-fold PLP-dependent enzyme [uncultured Thiodictyon sp.]